MLEETGTVVRAEAGELWVETQPRSACSQCSSGGCGTAVVSKLFGARPNRIRVSDSLGAGVGDRVVIGIPDSLLVRAALWAYLAPLLAMLAAAAVAEALGVGDAPQMLSALAGLALGLVLVRRVTRWPGAGQRFRPRLLRLAVGGGLEVPFTGLGSAAPRET